MDEKKTRKLLTRLTVIVACISVALFLFTGCILYYLFFSLRTYTHEQMQLEAAEYKSRILKQIDKDFQILHSLSTFLSFTDSLSREDLVEGLYQINATNDFVSMALFFSDGSGMINTLEYGTSSDYPLASSHAYVQNAVSRAFQGQDAVSLMFESQISGDLVYMYAVPVMQNGQITAVLCAIDHLEIFEEILGGNTVLNGNGYIHMLGVSGSFLIRSKYSIVNDPGMTSIFDGPYIGEDQKQYVRDSMQKQESVFSSFRYEDIECLFYLEPIGINGWYLFCVNRLSDASGALYPILLVVGGAFAIMLLLSSTLLLYGYRALRRNSKQLLHLAYFDSLTGAENMLRFTQRIDEFLPRRLPYSIVAVNIRRFKFINELFGQEQGDQLLRYVMQTIRGQMRDGEFFCRDAADLYYLLIRDIQEASIRQRLGEIVRQVSQAALSRQNHYEISLYCGVAINGSMMQALLALQSIKHTYHTDVAFYDEKLHQKERFKNRIASPDHFPQGPQGNIQSLPPSALHQRPGVDDHSPGPHPVSHQAGPGDVANGFLQGFGVRVGQVDKVRGMEGQSNTALPSGQAHLSGGLLPHVDPLAALVLVAVQPQFIQPLGGVCGGLVGEVLRVAGRAKHGTHCYLCSLPLTHSHASPAPNARLASSQSPLGFVSAAGENFAALPCSSFPRETCFTGLSRGRLGREASLRSIRADRNGSDATIGHSQLLASPG